MVLNGIDCIEKYAYLFKGKRIGLITSPTGLTRNFVSTIDIIKKNFNLTALFSPEHGVRGDMDAGALVDTYTDKYTGVPVYSLYRKDSKHLSQEMLDKVDLILYDIQDVGVRYYTFINTMLYALEDCAKSGKEFVILDRVNPLNGVTVEGNILKDEFKSFVGAYPLAVRYGLTVGEFAKMANSQMKLNCNLNIIPCENWDRNMLFCDTDLHWIMPSIGMPTFETALLYPGTCVFEGTNISEGRGTTAPFSIIGAPFIDAKTLADEMNKKKIDGVYFRPIYFTPTSSKFKGEKCGGVNIHITDIKSIKSLDIGVQLMYEIKHIYGDKFEFLAPYSQGSRQFIDLLCGDDIYRTSNLDVNKILHQFKEESKAFLESKQEFHIY